MKGIIVDHIKRDRNSRILKQYLEEGQSHAWDKDFKVLGNNYCSAFKRKISVALFIKHLKPSINPLQPSVAYQYPLKTTENLFQLHVYNSLLIYDATHLKFQILMNYYLLLFSL